jgi:hypothetical protein
MENTMELQDMVILTTVYAGDHDDEPGNARVQIDRTLAERIVSLQRLALTHGLEQVVEDASRMNVEFGDLDEGEDTLDLYEVRELKLYVTTLCFWFSAKHATAEPFTSQAHPVLLVVEHFGLSDPLQEIRELPKGDAANVEQPGGEAHPATDGLQTVKVMVLCTGADGSPSFYFCRARLTKEDYDEGKHYDLAKEKAASEGYEDPMMAFDESDNAGRQLRDSSTRDWIASK